MRLIALLPRQWHLCAVALGALLVVTMAGCSSGKGDVSGTVKLDGKPLPAGTISFTPAKGPAVSAEIKDGQYTAPGVPAGNVKVTVDTSALKLRADQLRASAGSHYQPPPGVKMDPNAKKKIDEEQKENAARQKEAQDLMAKYRPIPEKYTKPDSSGLSTTVKTGANTFDANLSSK